MTDGQESTYQNVTAADDGVSSVSNTAVRWTNSVPDLKNSQADPLIESLLEPAAADTMDANNRAQRLQNRHDSIFALFRPQPEVML